MQLRLWVNEKLVEDVQANGHRPDLQAAGFGDGCRAFNIQLRRHLQRGVNEIRLFAETTEIFRTELDFDDLRCAIDLFDKAFLNGWVDASGPASPVQLLVNGIDAGSHDATIYRADLEAAGMGDGRRGFSVRLDRHLRDGLNHVVLAWQGRRLLDEYIHRGPMAKLLPEISADRAAALKSSGPRLLRPLDGEEVTGPRCAVVARATQVGRSAICSLFKLSDVVRKRPADWTVCAQAPLAAAGEDLLMWGELDGLMPNEHYVVTVSDEGGGVESALVRSVHWSAGEYDRQKPASLVGPIRFAQAAFSNFRGPDEVLLEFEELDDPALLLSSARSGLEYVSVFPAEDLDSKDTFDLASSVGAGIPRFDELAPLTKWKSASGYFCALPKATLFLHQGVVLFGENLAWGDARVPAGNLDPDYQKVPGMVRDGADLKLVIPRHADFGGDVVPVMLFLSYNHAHWLENSAAAAWYAWKMFGPATRFIVPRTTPVMKESFSLLSIPDANVIALGDAVCSFDRLIYPSLLSTHVCGQPSPALREPFAALGKAADERRPEFESPSVIFISRRDANSAVARELDNEDELVGALRLFGVTVVRPHEYSLIEQIKIFRRAKVVIAPSGAALINTAFSPADCAVVEICSSHGYHIEWQYFMHVFGHLYVRVMSEPSSTSWAGGYRITVPVKRVVDIVGTLLRKRVSA